MATINLGATDFEQTVAENDIVFVDFWAAWCGPCRVAAPEVERTAGNMAGRALVLKVDTEAHPELAAMRGFIADVAETAARLLR